MAEKKEISDELKAKLVEMCDFFDKEDRTVRERQVRMYKKLKFYWDGIQRIWWDEVAHDYRTYDQAVQAGQIQDQQGYYDKPVNIYRAYLESIIAALSVVIPPVKCYPDDAENVLDLQTARAGDKIAELIYRHNDAVLLWLHALFIVCTEGMIAAYHYSKEDKAYGTYIEKEYKDEVEQQQYEACSLCQQQMVDEPLNQAVQNEFNPGEEDAMALAAMAEGMKFCANCMSYVKPDLQTKPIVVTKLVGETELPKSRQCIEVHGGLFVKVALYAQQQKDTPYLIYKYETHYANVLERYPHLKEQINPNSQGNQRNTGNSYAGASDPYERWARQSTQYRGEFPINTPTCWNVWLRPCAYNIINDDEMVAQLKKDYPQGVKVVLVDGVFAEVCPEALDDYWTLTYNPLSDYLHHDPLGVLLTNVQDITNELISLVIQTIEHGIPQTFVDTGVLDLEAYQQIECAPGSIIAAIPKSGKPLAESFFQIKTANLSGEVLPFFEKTNELGQLTSGALPSLFGGSQPNSSKTAAQYSMSRAQAMQRLQTTWKMLTIWWKNIFGKVIPAYIEDVVEDERFVSKDKNVGNFVNTVIRMSELQGKIGRVELEANEQLPFTQAQQKDIIMQFMQANNPILMQALVAPENVEYLKNMVGLSQFTIPGEDDREKQLEEIKMLTESAPMMNPLTGMEEPSVDIEPMVDNNQIHSEICRGWAVSEAGRLCKIENPDGYKNVLLHKIRHDEMVMLQMQEMQAMQPQPQPNAAGQGKAPGNGQPKNGEDKAQSKPMAAQVRTNVGLQS